jgi:hypothetical protein
MAKTKRAKLGKVIDAGYEYVTKVAVPQADGFHGEVPWFHGWAIREAFIAGANWQHDKDKEALKKWLN